ncbi:MAG: Rhodomycin D methylesterase DauP [Chlamydiales bacterium]|nr:Rhodomycin D methylesterase DauP [Chlamydiales bacterium]
MTTQKTVEVEGRQLWTESLGDPIDPAVLLISGAGAHAHFWTDTFCRSLIEAGFFLIRYDLRDVGLSDSGGGDYTLQDLVDDAIGILNVYNIRAAHIVGHSMGSYIGQLMALSHPERMLSLTSLSAGPAGETERLLAPQTDTEKEVMIATWRVMLRNRPTQDFEESYPGFAAVWERLNGNIAVDESLARAYTQEMYTRSRYPVGAHEPHMKVMQQMAQTLKERKEMFTKITLPTLIIHGAEDPLVPLERGGKALAEVLPQAELEVIPEMGHMLFDRSLQEKIAGRVALFLRGVRA